MSETKPLRIGFFGIVIIGVLCWVLVAWVTKMISKKHQMTPLERHEALKAHQPPTPLE